GTDGAPGPEERMPGGHTRAWEARPFLVGETLRNRDDPVFKERRVVRERAVERRAECKQRRIGRGIRRPLKEAPGDTTPGAPPGHAGATRRDVARPVRQRNQVAGIRSDE